MTEVTRLLSAIDAGDPHAAEQLLPLRKLAAQRLAQEKPGQTGSEEARHSLICPPIHRCA